MTPNDAIKIVTELYDYLKQDSTKTVEELTFNERELSDALKTVLQAANAHNTKPGVSDAIIRSCHICV